MSKTECLEFLDSAEQAIAAMREILEEGDPEAPLAFLEAAMDAQDMLSKSVHVAMVSALRG